MQVGRALGLLHWLGLEGFDRPTRRAVNEELVRSDAEWQRIADEEAQVVEAERAAAEKLRTADQAAYAAAVARRRRAESMALEVTHG